MKSEKDCIFCKIVQGDVPAVRLYEDEDFLCIRDIQPQAKTHLLMVSKEHIASLDVAFPATGPGAASLLGKLFEASVKVARAQGLLPEGYRSIINTNQHGGQTVYHLHMHLLGGQPLHEGLV